MTAAELRQLFPHATETFIRRNATDLPVAHAHAPRPAPPPLLERRDATEPLDADKAEARDAGKFVVRVTSFRLRLLDEDNLCEKYLVDGLRYAGLLPSDAPDRCRIITTQKKVARQAEEHTRIVIMRNLHL